MRLFQTIKQFLLVFVISFVLWLLLTGSLVYEELVAGVLVASVAAIFSLEKPHLLSDIRLGLKTPYSLLAYLLVFFGALIKANIDMARRVILPVMPLNPKMIRVKTNLQSDLGKLVLANSITLTPGTLSVEVEENEILVHWIECPPGCDTQMATREIAAGFEKHLMGFLK